MKSNKKIKILFTASEFMHSSQTQNLCDLVELLDKNIFNIEISSITTKNVAYNKVKSLGVPIYNLRLFPSRKVNSHMLLSLIKGLFFVAKKRYDLVHSLLYQSWFTEPLAFKYLSNTKYVYTKTNLQWDNHPFLWKRKSSLADRIVSISNATDNLLTNKGFGHKIKKIYLGVNTEKFKFSKEKRKLFRQQLNIPKDALLFGCAAHFLEWKEHLTLLSAFEKLAELHNNIYLIYAGGNHGDDYYSKFKKRLSESMFNSRIIELGAINKMVEFYSGIDVFVLPSRYETFGYVYVEAMSCEKPVIACAAGGPLEIIDENNTGYFTKMSNPVDLSKQMLKYINNPNNIVIHGKNGREKVNRVFSREVMVQQCNKLYLDILNYNKPVKS